MDSSCSVCNEMCIMVEKCVLHNYSLLQVGPFNAQKLATCFHRLSTMYVCNRIRFIKYSIYNPTVYIIFMK